MAAKSTNKGGVTGLATALVGAVAAGFYLYGPEGAQARVKIKAWSLKARAEVLEQIEKARDISDESYAELVDRVTARYGKLKTVGEVEALKLNKELKRHWRAIKRTALERSTPAAK